MGISSLQDRPGISRINLPFARRGLKGILTGLDPMGEFGTILGLELTGEKGEVGDIVCEISQFSVRREALLGEVEERKSIGIES